MSTIGDTCKVVNGGTPKTKIPKYWGGPHQWITPAEMGQRLSPYISSSERTLTDEGLRNSSARLLPPGSLILSTRAPIGYVVSNTQPMAFNQGCKGLVPGETVQTKYLYYYLTSIVDLLNDLGTGATFKELPGGKLKRVPIPVPPLDEQKRIVAILDEAFAGIDAAIANTEKNLKNARELFGSHLGAAFARKSSGWEEKPVGELAEQSLGKMLDKRKNRGAPKKYLRNLNVRWFEFDLDDMLEMKFEEHEAERYTIRKGDLVICEGGYPGRAAIWNRDDTVYFQKALHRVRFHNPDHARWFLYFLYYSDMTGSLKRHFTGTGIKHFTGRALSRFLVPIGPNEVIRGEVDKFDDLFERLRTFDVLNRQKLARLLELKQSILQKAFTGELTGDRTGRDVAAA